MCPPTERVSGVREVLPEGGRGEVPGGQQRRTPAVRGLFSCTHRADSVQEHLFLVSDGQKPHGLSTVWEGYFFFPFGTSDIVDVIRQKWSPLSE